MTVETVDTDTVFSNELETLGKTELSELTVNSARILALRYAILSVGAFYLLANSSSLPLNAESLKVSAREWLGVAAEANRGQWISLAQKLHLEAQVIEMDNRPESEPTPKAVSVLCRMAELIGSS
jgi:hypothetical protein